MAALNRIYWSYPASIGAKGCYSFELKTKNERGTSLSSKVNGVDINVLSICHANAI